MSGVRRRALIVAAAAAALVVAAVLARHVIARVALQAVLSVATGYRVQIGSDSLGTTHATLFDVHVTKNGDPVLDAQRIDVDYALRDIFPGGEHRYGFAAIAMQKPVLTITRHADGSLTFNRPGGTPATPPAPSRKAAEPLYFTVRVREGALHLVDEAPAQRDLANQEIDDVTIDASVKSDARTTASVSGVLIGRATPGTPLARYPIAEHSIIDVPRGIALNTVTAARLPLRGLLGFLIHSSAIRFDGGMLENVRMHYYALAPKPTDTFAYQLGGQAYLRGGRLAVSALVHEIRDVNAPVLVSGDTLATPTIAATLGGIPVRGRGALYDLFGSPQFRIGFAADTDLHDLRTLFAFTRKLPLSGRAHFETLLASSLDEPLIHTEFSGPHVAYDRYTVDGVGGIVDYYRDAIDFGGISARYGSANVAIGGRVLVGKNGDDVGIAMSASGPGASLPYAATFAPDSSVIAAALITEPPHGGFSARGTIGLRGGTAGAGTFSVNPRGVGEFGPFAFARTDGESLAGGFELQRPISASAGWLHARAFRLADVRRMPALPGAAVPAMPPISGIIDGDFAGGGSPDVFGLAGALRGEDLRYGPYALGSGSVRLGGTMRDVRLADIRLAGPLGRFAGNGAFDGDTFALDGTYDGSLDALRQFTGDAGAHGPIHGPVRATIAQGRIVVQTTGADLAGASFRGVGIDRVAGTLLVDGAKLRIIAADGTVAGGHVVAADAGGPFLVATPGIPAAGLRGAGLPLESGTVGVFGLADLRGRTPAFDGLVDLADGRAAGYPIAAGADVALADGTAHVRRGVAALGTTYGRFGGRIYGVGVSGPDPLAYDVNASIPIGDIDDVRRTLRVPVRYLDGSFSAQLHVRGNGARPRLAGAVDVPEGSYNGLAFRDATADVAVTPSSFSASDGVVTVGSTRAQVDASMSIASRAFAVDARSAHANLADFNDYFDEAETFAGTGSVAVSFATGPGGTRSSGLARLSGLRYRQFAFGNALASWSQRHGTIAGTLGVAGTHGTLNAGGTIAPAAGDPIVAFEHAAYHVHVRAQRVELASWLPPAGITAPILGQIDANGSADGRWPRLAVTGDASLTNGSMFGYTVDSAVAHMRADGGRVSLTNTQLKLGFAQLDANGSFGLSRTAPLAMSVHVQTPDVAKALAAMFPRGPSFGLSGALQSEARIAGTFAHPDATVGFDMTDARYASLAIARVLGSVRYDGKTFVVQDAEATFAKGGVLIAGQLPLSLRPLAVPADAPLSFTLAAQNLDLAPFAPFLPGPQTKLGGTVNGRLAIEGTVRAPRVAGTIALAGGSYVSSFDRAPIAKANASLDFTGTTVALQALHANVGSGTIDGSGRLDLPFAEAHAGTYAIALTAHSARIDSPQFGTGTIDGTMQLRSGTPAPTLSGNVTLSNASIPVLSIYRSATASSASGGSGGLPFNVAFDLAAQAGRNVRVHASSPYIDIGTTGTLDLTGTLRAPKLAGVLTATPGGVFSTYNRAFRVQQASVAFEPQSGLLPYIRLRAYAHVTDPDPDPSRNPVGSADITVTVDGPADELAAGTGGGIAYSSSPPYSQEQIVGLLLDASVFGAVNFGQQPNGTTLRGAPGESNALLPPGVTPYQTGVINFNEEAFSVLNGQFTQRFLAPLDTFFTGRFGLSDFELTVDYGGGIGYNALKQIGHGDVYASFGQSYSEWVRTTVGFTARPDATTSLQFNYFTQNGSPALTSNYNGSEAILGAETLKGIQPLSNRQGFTFSVVRKYP